MCIRDRLPHFKRFLLIGDHKQLPAVVVQSPDASKIEDEDLQNIGLYNLRDSLFERMYKRCIKNNWTWAYASLTHQGRMHQDIMKFPSEKFYNESLKILPKESIDNTFQIKPIDYQIVDSDSIMEEVLCESRMVFLPSVADPLSKTGKTNASEAKLISEVVATFQKIYKNNDLEFTPTTLGVITPYRAQIAQIRHALQEHAIDTNTLTIDTVERYQGGARDIILISLCTNSINQLTSLVSVSDEGVDRKLNVALTRARKHLVIIGNTSILKENSIYAALIKTYLKPIV